MICCPQFHLSLESFSFDSNVPNTQVQRMWSLNILDKALPILPLSTAKNCYDDGNSQLKSWTSLVAQQLRIHLPVQETWVQPMIQEDPICCGDNKSSVQLGPHALEPILFNKRNHHNEKPIYPDQRKPTHSSENRVQPKIKKEIKFKICLKAPKWKS